MILIVPMCLVASISGVILRGMDNNILTQVGFVVLIGLAAKNAILIVEFARQLEDQGRNRFAAAVEAARLRLRPILTTSLAFIFGVVPLAWSVGAGAETAPGARYRGVRRDDRRDCVRADLHAGVLRDHPLAGGPVLAPEQGGASTRAATRGMTRRQRDLSAGGNHASCPAYAAKSACHSASSRAIWSGSKGGAPDMAAISSS